MSRILYERRCKCKELEITPTQKTKRNLNSNSPKKLNRSEGFPLSYPKYNEITSRIFQIKYDKQLSLTGKIILNSFQNKYLYYAIDDILYLLRSNYIEQNNLLSIIYTPILSLQNNFSINLFDIWIQEIYVNEVPRINKFITNNSKYLEQYTYITIKLLYKNKVPIKKQSSLW